MSGAVSTSRHARWIGSKLLYLNELVTYALNIVASYILTGVLTANSAPAAVLTFWDCGRPPWPSRTRWRQRYLAEVFSAAYRP